MCKTPLGKLLVVGSRAASRLYMADSSFDSTISRSQALRHSHVLSDPRRTSVNENSSEHTCCEHEDFECCALVPKTPAWWQMSSRF